MDGYRIKIVSKYLNIVVDAYVSHGVDDFEGIVETLFSSRGVSVHILQVGLYLYK